MVLSKKTKILIIGLGLIGGSYAKALTGKGYSVSAISRSKKTIDYALKEGYIQSGTTEVEKDFVASFDVIIFGLYPKAMISWMKKYVDYIKPRALILDVTGVKGCLVPEIEDIIAGKGLHYVSTHPMAGREKSGIRYADPTVFQKANYIIVPSAFSDGEDICFAQELARELEFKRITIMGPDEHDEMIAFLSQLTHVIAVSLMNANDSPDLVKYTGDSFRDLTRIAKINETMWTELFLENKEALLKQMDAFEASFNKMRDAIRNGDETTLKDMMKLSTSRRDEFDK